MQTQIVKNFHINESIDKVWNSLSDPADIVTCVPGAAITEKIDDKNYKGEVITKFGPIKASYTGDIAIEELDLEQRRMVLAGKGIDSKGKGNAEMKMLGVLVENEGGTDVSFTMDITIIGKLAQFGSRLINDVSDQLLNQFVNNFQEKLTSESIEEPVSTEDAISGEAVEPAAGKVVGKKEENAFDAGSLFGTVLKSIFASIGDFFRSLFGGSKRKD